MAASPPWKVYNAANEYRASFVCVEEAAVLVAALGDGSTIRLGHAKRDAVWIEGHDGSAGESYDYVSEIAHGRREDWAAQNKAERERQNAEYLAKHPELVGHATRKEAP